MKNRIFFVYWYHLRYEFSFEFLHRFRFKCCLLVYYVKLTVQHLKLFLKQSTKFILMPLNDNNRTFNIGTLSDFHIWFFPLTSRTCSFFSYLQKLKIYTWTIFYLPLIWAARLASTTIYDAIININWQEFKIEFNLILKSFWLVKMFACSNLSFDSGGLISINQILIINGSICKTIQFQKIISWPFSSSSKMFRTLTPLVIDPGSPN